MGATVTCGKHAAAFESNGRVIYALFERTYEKNCHPHTPSWHPVSYGTYEAVMKWVFLAASSCEGGMLQNTRGYIRPENYLADWMRKLKAPALMPNIAVDLYVGQPGYWRVPIEADGEDRYSIENQKTQVLSRLRAEGFFDVADKLDAGQIVTENLHDCVDLLEVIYPGGRYIWRVINETTMPRVANKSHPELAPAIRTAQVTPLNWKTWRIQNDDDLLIKHDGTCTGERPYSIVGSYINEVAYQMEMQRTGSAVSAITRFRDMVNSAPALPGDTRVTIRRNPEKERWSLEAVDDLAKALGVADGNGHAPPVFTTSLHVLREADRKDQTVIWRLKSIKDATWDIPSAETHVSTSQYQQLDLLSV